MYPIKQAKQLKAAYNACENWYDFLGKHNLEKSKHERGPAPRAIYARAMHYRKAILNDGPTQSTVSLYADYRQNVIKAWHERQELHRIIDKYGHKGFSPYTAKPYFDTLPKGKVVVSGCKVYYDRGMYTLISHSPYYGGGTYQPYTLLYRSHKPIDVEVWESGDASHWAYGFFNH